MRIQFTMQSLVTWLLCWVSTVAFAAGEEPRQVDLELTGSVEPSIRLLPGSHGTVQVQFRNLGPDLAINPRAVSNDYVTAGPGEQMILFAVPETAPCTAHFEDLCGRPGEPCFNAVGMGPGEMLPGQVVECSLGILVSPLATGRFDLEFRTFDLSPNVVDPDPSNDSVVFGLMFLAPRDVPTLHVWGALLLASLLAGLCRRDLLAFVQGQSGS